MMKLMMAVMRMVPKKLANKIKAPMIAKARMIIGKDHPTIKMNLTNLLLCACSSCPSFPVKFGEALYCASGKSNVQIEQIGCNCLACALYDKCSGFNAAYFCINGRCGATDRHTMATKLSNLTGSYLQRFIPQDTSIKEKIEKDYDLSDGNVGDVILHFEGEKDVKSKSNIPILNASLTAGIPHTHVCGGRARCSTCRVLVSKGLDHCKPRNSREANLARIKGFSSEIRLACQATVGGDVTLRRLVLDNTDISVAINEGRSDISNVGREIEVSILFSDIRSFTAFSENALPYDVIHILNRYFETIGQIIDDYGGYIDKYMGDGIMAIFGLDNDFKGNPSKQSVLSAQKIILSLKEFNSYLKSRFNHEFKIGIGIHTGNVIMGSLGFHKKTEYTAIGDTVNTASRIEALNKKTGTSILISDDTYKLVRKDFQWGRKFKATVKGKEEAIYVYELLDNAVTT